MAEHTKGPWFADTHHTQDYAGRTHGFIRAPGQLAPIGAIVLGVEGMSQDEGRANLALAAAADEMLAVLKDAAPLIAEAQEALCGNEACTDADGNDALHDLRERIDAALARAVNS